MKKIKIIILSFLIFIILLVVTIFLKSNIYKITDSLVFIKSINSSGEKEGMGFVYKIEDGISYIVTNYHVIDDFDRLYIYNLNDEKTNANVINFDKYTDIALLSIKDNLNLKEVKINNKDIEINHEVYYFNIEKTALERGIILSLDNKINLSTDYGTSFYNVGSFSGNIERGNSGGPLFNKDNEMIGLISLKEQQKNIGFYLTIEYVMNVVTKLENHELVRPNLGGKFANTTNIDLLSEFQINVSNIDGVVVLDVIKDYPLDISNIIKGDVITKINNKVIKDVSDLQAEIYSHDIGSSIILEYYRNNEYSEVKVILNK